MEHDRIMTLTQENKAGDPEIYTYPFVFTLVSFFW